MSRALMLVLAMLVAAPAAKAQRGRESDSLPRELVNAILGGSGGARSVDVQAGRADEAIPVALFSDATLLGVGTFPFMSMTVAYFPYPPQATLDTIHERLLASGWQAPQQEAAPSRGFLGATSAPERQVYCHERATLAPTVSVRSLNRTLAVITRQWVEGGVPYACAGRAVQRVSLLDDTPVPALHPPPGTEVAISGVTAGTDTWLGRASITGRVTVASLMMHYSNQFAAAGWTKAEEVLADGIAAATLTLTGMDGQRWHCTLTAAQPGRAGSVNMVLQLSRL